jgi:WhiB family redox-sensing transcriptional regulator
MVDAACLQVDPDLMFAESAAVQATVAAVLCGPCPVRAACLADALAAACEWGVRGGTTERQRRALIAARGEVAA